MPPKKTTAIPVVDINTALAEQAEVADTGSDIVDANTIPTPADLSELAIHVGIVEGGVDIEPTNQAGIDTMLGKSAAAMANKDEDGVTTIPDDGDYVTVFYHPQTRKYVQFNQALVGRNDFQQRRVAKADFAKLRVSA